MKRQITREQWLALGGAKNPKLFRVLKHGSFTYWMNE